jgi:hypothetical protein
VTRNASQLFALSCFKFSINLPEQLREFTRGHVGLKLGIPLRPSIIVEPADECTKLRRAKILDFTLKFDKAHDFDSLTGPGGFSIPILPGSTIEVSDAAQRRSLNCFVVRLFFFHR